MIPYFTNVVGDPRMPQRFWDRVEVFGEVDCWMWTGNTSREGYGRIWWNGRKDYTHRVVYQTLVGPIPVGLVTDHLCKVRNCCNPAHLEPVTCGENTRRGVWNIGQALCASKTHCVRGHEFTPENMYRTKRNARVCRACDHARQARRRDRMRALYGRSRR